MARMIPALAVLLGELPQSGATPCSPPALVDVAVLPELGERVRQLGDPGSRGQ